MNHDDDLQEFFAALRAQDEKQVPPPFKGLPVRTSLAKRRLLWPLTAAAAAVLLLFAWWPGDDAFFYDDSSNALNITVNVEENTQTQTLLRTPESIDSWESPSASLIEDF